MLNTEDAPIAVSLDSLLGLQQEVEEQLPAEEPVQTAPSVDLLSMLGLATEDDKAGADVPTQEEPAVREAAVRDDIAGLWDIVAHADVAGDGAAKADEASGDLRALLGLGASDRTDDVPDPEPALAKDPAPVASPTSSRAAAGAPARSRFADAPAFRQPEKRAEPRGAAKPSTARAEAPAAPASPGKAASAVPAPPAASPDSKDPAIPVTPAVRLLAGEGRPLGLPACAQAKGRAAVPVERKPQSSEPARPAQAEKSAKPERASDAAKPERAGKPAKPVQPAKPQRAGKPAKPAQSSKPAPQPQPACSPEPAKPQRAGSASSEAKPESAGRPAVEPTKPATPSAPKAPAVVEPVSRPAAVSNPLRRERPPRPAKSTNGVWYLASACLFVLALACTCYAVYAAAQGAEQQPPASIATSSPDEAAVQRYRYSVQGSDGTVRSVMETARFGIDGFVAESTVSFEAQNESEAALFLEDAQARFGDAWVSGSIEDGKAVFTIKHENKLDREAYGALLEATTIDCESVPQ